MCNYINKYKKNIFIKTSTNFANKLQIQIKEKPYFQFRTYEKTKFYFQNAYWISLSCWLLLFLSIYTINGNV